MILNITFWTIGQVGWIKSSRFGTFGPRNNRWHCFKVMFLTVHYDASVYTTLHSTTQQAWIVTVIPLS
jgi:hypothetical protein